MQIYILQLPGWPFGRVGKYKEYWKYIHNDFAGNIKLSNIKNINYFNVPFIRILSFLKSVKTKAWECYKLLSSIYFRESAQKVSLTKSVQNSDSLINFCGIFHT